MTIKTYMAEQPRVIADAFEAGLRRIGELGLSGRERLTLVGSGSSRNACLFAEPFLGDARIVPPAEFLGRPDRQSDAAELVVVLTQSGASATSVAAARRAHAQGARVVVVTANPAGTAAGLGLPVVLMPVGDEPIGPKTKGYTASCASLLALAASRGAAIDPPNPAALGDALDHAWQRAGSLAAEFDRLDFVLAAGAGAGHGTALEGSLKIAEIAGVPTAAFSMEETLHGRLHGTTPASLVLPIVADADAAAQAELMRAALVPYEVRVEPVHADVPGLPASWSMLAATFFFQALAVELCLRRNREPDLMHYPALTRQLDIKTDGTL